jgi:UDP-2-acetamido-3-amino-2,3-dideoxy-glucuronate N-acetyltransferase
MGAENQTIPFFAHPTAVIDEGAEIGCGSKIWHWVHVSAKARIGSNSILGQNVYVGAVKIGSNVKIQNNVSIFDGVEIEDDVFCGPSMVFTNVINPRSHIVRKHEYRPTIVRQGASIGANAVIVCGHTIGRFAMIGAGAVVTKDVPDFGLVAGNPARRIGWICQCGIRLQPGEGGRAECAACNWRYRVSDSTCSVVEPGMIANGSK